jgi:hypothetical protein
MGLRSWLSPITEKSQWDEVQTSIDENPYANGIHYVLKIEKQGTPFPLGSVVVAWSGDGSSSVKELRPIECRNNTWLLDNLLDDFPEWHTEPGGPNKFGTALVNDMEIENALKKS